MYTGAGIISPQATYTEDQFEGDGSTVAFTLSETLAADAEAFVFIQGALQDTDQYTISSKTLTFSSAPADGVLVRVRYARREVTNYLSDNTVGVDQLTGVSPVIQVVYTIDGDTEYDITATTPAFDDTIPQISEGTEVSSINTSITPKHASNILEIEACVALGHSASDVGRIMALFEGSTADALVATIDGGITDASEGMCEMRLKFFKTAGSTNARTYSVRIGTPSGIAHVNQVNNASRLGGVAQTYMKVTEYSVAL